MPIHSTDYLKNYTQYLITKTTGTLEIYYYGTVLDGYYSEGCIFVFEASNMKNLTRVLMFPSQNTIKFSTTASNLMFFYVGPSANNIAIVARIKELHSKNCQNQDNVDISSFTSGVKQVGISSTNDGDCLYSIITPNVNSYKNFTSLFIRDFTYEGERDVFIVSGYNTTYSLFRFNSTMMEWRQALIMFGLLFSIIIPKNSKLYVEYSTEESFCKILLFQLSD